MWLGFSWMLITKYDERNNLTVELLTKSEAEIKNRKILCPYCKQMRKHFSKRALRTWPSETSIRRVTCLISQLHIWRGSCFRMNGVLSLTNIWFRLHLGETLDLGFRADAGTRQDLQSYWDGMNAFCIWAYEFRRSRGWAGVEYYGLDAYVPTSPTPNTLCNPNVPCDHISRWGLGWWLGYEDRTFMNGIGAFTRESSEGLLALYSQWGHKEKWAVCNQEEWLQAGSCHRTWGSFAKTLTAFSFIDSLLWFFNFLRPLLCLNYLLFEPLSAWIRNCMDHALVYILAWKTMSFFLLPP